MNDKPNKSSSDSSDRISALCSSLGIQGRKLGAVPDSTDRIHDVVDAFEAVWSVDDRPNFELYLNMVEAPLRPRLLEALLGVECELLRRAGQIPSRDNYLARFPEHAEIISDFFRSLRSFTDSKLAGGNTEKSDPENTSNTLTVKSAKPNTDNFSNLTLGNYELQEKIGAGGMGAVYKARHIRLDKLVAVKLLPSDYLKNEQAVGRFRREMQAVGKLDHPNIVRAMDAGEVDGKHYLVMEFVEGMDLSRYVKRHGPLPVEEAVDFIRQAARGLEYAHRRGLIHRDIKPANLLICLQKTGNGLDAPVETTDMLFGQIKVSDLGLALIDGETHKEDSLTSTGAVMGTAEYMSPEQAEDMHQVDARTDIYSLGCTLFYLLTGHAPYQADTHMRRLLAHRDQPIPSLSEIITKHSTEGAAEETADYSAGTKPVHEGRIHWRPKLPQDLAPLDEVFRKMLAKRPEDRFASMAEVASALGKLKFVNPSVSNSVSSPTTHTAGQTSNSLKRTILFAAAIITIALIGLIIAVVTRIG